MKNLTRLSLLPLLAFGAFACEKSEGLAGEADLQVTAKMIGETLSDEREGLMASLADATAKPEGQSLFGVDASEVEMAHPGGPGGPGGQMGPKHGRGGERNVVVSYDSVTGVHTVTFERTVTHQDLTKTVSFNHKYIYKDAAGAFVQFPKRQGFASVEFDGTKQGSASGVRGTSSFNRNGKFTLTGNDAAASALDFDGEFSGNGNHSLTDPDSNVVTRTMTFKYVLSNISIAKTALTLENPLSEGVTGTINYKVDVVKTINGVAEEQNMEGTIELTGDGTALLEYLGHGRKFILNLNSGDAQQRRRP